jgi:Zn-dependent protease with chaperone function
VLTDDELQALIAHECAHIWLGHCRLRAQRGLMLKMAFLGHLATAAWEDSLQMETDADDHAVRSTTINAHDLANALDVAAGMASQVHSGWIGALSATQSTALVTKAGSLWKTSTAWLSAYVHGGDVGYWHPHLEERVKRLRDMPEEIHE